jgi:hypothetical protein
MKMEVIMKKSNLKVLLKCILKIVNYQFKNVIVEWLLIKKMEWIKMKFNLVIIFL